MAFIVDEQVEAYAEAHTTPSGELFERLAAETREKTTAPQMMVGEIEGRFLEFLVRQRRERCETGLAFHAGAEHRAIETCGEGRTFTAQHHYAHGVIGKNPGADLAQRTPRRGSLGVALPRARERDRGDGPGGLQQDARLGVLRRRIVDHWVI